MAEIYDHTWAEGRKTTWTGCLYVPSFPAWALERVAGPGGPVVALHRGGAVAWRRVPALREVRAGDRSDRIARLCPEARIRIRNASVEHACWEEVIDALNRITPFIAPSRPPWAWFRVEAADPLRDLAARLDVRVGVGADRATARLAAVRSVDRHLLFVPPRRRRAFLDRFDVDRLVEIGMPGAVPERLHLFGYPTLGAVAELTRRQLEAQFGEEGTSLHALLHPEADRPIPLHVPPPSVDVVEEPDMPVCDAPLTALAERLARRAAGELGTFRTQRIVLEVHPEGMLPRRASRLLPEPHHRADTLARFVLRLLPEVVRPSESITRLGLRLDALRRPDTTQTDLFSARPDVLRAVRQVHRRYPGLVRRAVLRPHALLAEDEVALETFDDDASRAA